jgi:hypothetical protein
MPVGITHGNRGKDTAVVLHHVSVLDVLHGHVPVCLYDGAQ